MELSLKRIQLDPDVTIGQLSIDGVANCFVCEDTVRPPGAPKVWGQTAIPAGRYRVIITWSPHFNRMLPLLVNVPGFEGIRMHPGNKAADTDGCLLPGLDRLPKGVGRSVLAFEPLMTRIAATVDAGSEVFIEVA